MSLAEQHAGARNQEPQQNLHQNPALRRAFCEQLLKDDNAFLNAYHVRRENRDVEISAWQPQEGLGQVRVANFVSPLSVSSARCTHGPLLGLLSRKMRAADAALYPKVVGLGFLLLYACITLTLTWYGAGSVWQYQMEVSLNARELLSCAT